MAYRRTVQGQYYYLLLDQCRTSGFTFDPNYMTMIEATFSDIVFSQEVLDNMIGFLEASYRLHALTLNGVEYSDNNCEVQLFKAIADLPKLETLNLVDIKTSDVSRLSHLLISLLDTNTKISKLTISQEIILRDMIKSGIFDRRTNLITLDLSGLKFSSQTFLDLLTMLKSNTTLNHLKLSDCCSNVINLLDHLNCNTKLTSLDLSNCDVTLDDDEFNFYNTTLTTLNLSRCRLNHVPVKNLVKILGRPGMISLNLSANNLTMKPELALALEKADPEFLNLEGNMIDDLGLSFLMPVLLKSSHLRQLNLSQNQISDASIQALIPWLHSYKSLENLNLSYNWLTEIGLSSLCRAVADHPSISQLDVSKNRMQSKYEKLVDILWANSTLTYLRINFWNDDAFKLEVRNQHNFKQRHSTLVGLLLNKV